MAPYVTELPQGVTPPSFQPTKLNSISKIALEELTHTHNYLGRSLADTFMGKS